MRRLSLHTSRPGLVRTLLSEFLLPETTEVSVTIAAAKDQPLDSLLDTIPCDPRCLPILAAVSSARLSPGGFSCSSLDVDGSITVEFDLEELSRDVSWSYARDASWLREGSALLRHSRDTLRHLEVEGSLRGSGCADAVAKWRELFTALPRIQTLAVSELQEDDVVALAKVLNEDAETGAEGDRSDLSRIWAPELIRVELVPATDAEQEVIPEAWTRMLDECVRLRKEFRGSESEAENKNDI